MRTPAPNGPAGSKRRSGWSGTKATAAVFTGRSRHSTTHESRQNGEKSALHGCASLLISTLFQLASLHHEHSQRAPWLFAGCPPMKGGFCCMSLPMNFGPNGIPRLRPTFAMAIWTTSSTRPAPDRLHPVRACHSDTLFK